MPSSDSSCLRKTSRSHSKAQVFMTSWLSSPNRNPSKWLWIKCVWGCLADNSTEKQSISRWGQGLCWKIVLHNACVLLCKVRSNYILNMLCLVMLSNMEVCGRSDMFLRHVVIWNTSCIIAATVFIFICVFTRQADRITDLNKPNTVYTAYYIVATSFAISPSGTVFLGP